MVREPGAGNGTKIACRPLSRIRRRILRAAIAAMRPRGHGFDQPIDEDVLRDVECSLGHLPAKLRVRLGRGLYLMEYGPPVFVRRMRRFSRMTPDEARLYLASWEHIRGLRGDLFYRVRTLVFMSFYQHPDVLAALEIGWAERAETLARLRAELLYDRSREASGAS
jgi:hypothetical protein